MIEQRTVFVLGAGAHCSYGFPSGKDLKSQIIELVRAQTNTYYSNSENMLTQMVRFGAASQDETQPSRFKAFAESLERAGQTSIDAFLNANEHQSGFQKIGKAAIAQVLLEKEKSADYHPKDDDWLDYLFAIMLNGIKTENEFIEKNKIGFITFNYDRFLEKWLFERIQNSFGLNEDATLKILQRIPIHHVYGKLGDFPYLTNINPTQEWIKASQNIKTIFDAEKDLNTLDASKELLTNAKVVCLLGFGFHPENIELLELAQTINKDNSPNIVASSIYGITATEWERYTRPFTANKIKAPHPFDSKLKCLETLRNLPIF